MASNRINMVFESRFLDWFFFWHMVLDNYLMSPCFVLFNQENTLRNHNFYSETTYNKFWVSWVWKVLCSKEITKIKVTSFMLSDITVWYITGSIRYSSIFFCSFLSWLLFWGLFFLQCSSFRCFWRHFFSFKFKIDANVYVMIGI